MWLVKGYSASCKGISTKGMGNPCSITEYLLHALRPLERDGKERLDGEVGKVVKLLKHTVAVEARLLRDSHSSWLVVRWQPHMRN